MARRYTMTMTNRANKVTVKTVDNKMVATFWRTHKKVAEVVASNIGFEANEEANATANREAYRIYAIEHTELNTEIVYDPTDHRADSNKFPSHWTDEQQVQEWAYKMIDKDLTGWLSKIDPTLNIEEIALIGLVDEERYTSKDAIKNATIECDAHIFNETSQTSVLITLYIKSGQMTKPKLVGDDKWNMTNLKAQVLEDITVGADDAEDLSDMTVAELKEMIKADGLEIKGLGKMKKDEMITAIKSARA